MFGETTIFHVMIWNHPIETTKKKWMSQVPGTRNIPTVDSNGNMPTLDYVTPFHHFPTTKKHGHP